MALVASGEIAIKDDTLQVGSTSIALEVDGNTTGDKHLNSLGVAAGLSGGGTSMTEFYGYEAPTIPTAPTAVSLVWSSPIITFTWTDNSDNEDNFEVERTSSYPTGWGTRVDDNASPYSTTIADGTWYFRVRAVNAAGNSDWSEAGPTVVTN